MNAGENSLAQKVHWSVVALMFFACSGAAVNAGDSASAVGSRTVDFARDIEPIFRESCARCHGGERPKGNFSLETRERALRGGRHGAAIVAGRGAESRLVQFVARGVPDMEMPPEGKGAPLTAEQVARLQAWIDQGAVWPAGTNGPTFRFTAVPVIGGFAVGGNRRAFREIEGVREGLGGGLEEFKFEGTLRSGARLKIDGRANSTRDDYRARISIEKPEVGFVRGGVENRRRFYDGVGGFDPARQPSQFDLGRDLHVDFSRAWIEVGVARPDWPKATFGYERLVGQGSQPTLNWGAVGAVGASSIFPAFEQFRERVDVLRLDLSHEVAGFTLEDQFRAEFQDLRRTRENASVSAPPSIPDTVTRVHERHREQRLSNVFRAERRIRDWLLVSGGHFFSHADGDATFAQETLNGSGAPIFGDQWLGGPVTLKRDVQSLGGSALFGPWHDLTFSTAVQAEWTRQEGIGLVDFRSGDPSVPIYFSDPASLATSYDRTSVEELFGARFTGLPRTVVFAEARFRQEDQQRWEQQVGGAEAFLNSQDSTRDVKDFRLGANVAACEGVTISGHLKHRERHTRYVNLAGAPPPGHAYPGFIQALDNDTDEAEARVNWRPRPWLRASVSYRVQASEYRTATKDAADVFGTPGAGSPGGGLLGGKYSAQFFAGSVFVAPWRNVVFSGMISRGDSRLATAFNSVTFAPASRGAELVWNVGGSYAMDAATDFSASINWARADYRQSDVGVGLPAGTDFERRAVEAGISRRWSPRTATSVRYQFIEYREPTAGGARDYSAHGVFATFSMTLR